MTTLKLTAIRLDGGTQPRAAIDRAVVDEYASDMRTGDILPPATVFYDGADYWLADGFHRFEAAQAVGAIEIDCDVKQGTQRDAVLHSVGVNADHGLRRTNEDKRRAVETLLRDEEWSSWSNVKIADACRVSEGLVRSLRTKRSEPVTGNVASESAAPTERTYRNKHGGVSTMKTGKIGRKKGKTKVNKRNKWINRSGSARDFLWAICDADQIDQLTEALPHLDLNLSKAEMKEQGKELLAVSASLESLAEALGARVNRPKTVASPLHGPDEAIEEQLPEEILNSYPGRYYDSARAILTIWKRTRKETELEAIIQLMQYLIDEHRKELKAS